MNDLDARVVEAKIKMEETRQKIQRLRGEEYMLDDDGYPTEVALWCVENWPWDDPKGWFWFLRSIWWNAEWGWSEGNLPHEWEPDTMVYTYKISTGGWSGNESIIHAMESNHMLWGFTWVQSRRGGHYIFEKKVYEDE